MRIQVAEIQSFRKCFKIMYPDPFPRKDFAFFDNGVTTTFHPTDQGTLLVAGRLNHSLAKVIDTERCPASFSCSHHWLDYCPDDAGHIDIARSGKLVEFSRRTSKQLRVLSLIARKPTTSFASPVRGAADGQLITALAAASNILLADSKFDNWRTVRLDGSRGTVTSSNGYDSFSCSGFKFRWQERVFVEPHAVFNALDLETDTHVSCGVLADTLYITAGLWRLSLPLEFRIPLYDNGDSEETLGRVDNRVQLDPHDLAFLNHHLVELSKRKGPQPKVSLKLGRRVSVEIENTKTSPPKHLVLSRSSQRGRSANVFMMPWKLQQVVNLGFSKLHFHMVDERIVCSDDRRDYVFNACIGPSVIADDAIEIDSVTGEPVAL